MKDSYGLSVLRNVEKFPINQDESLTEYYEKIAVKIDNVKYTASKFSGYCYRIINAFALGPAARKGPAARMARRNAHKEKGLEMNSSPLML